MNLEDFQNELANCRKEVAGIKTEAVYLDDYNPAKEAIRNHCSDLLAHLELLESSVTVTVRRQVEAAKGPRCRVFAGYKQCGMGALHDGDCDFERPF